MILVSRVVLQDQVIKGSCNFVVRSRVVRSRKALWLGQ